MFDQQTADLIRENERMKVALHTIITYAASCTFGSWRQRVVDFAKHGLGL